MKQDGNFTLYENDIDTLITYASKNWDIIKLIESRRPKNNFIKLLLDRILSSHLFCIGDEQEFIEKYRKYITFENVQFTKQNIKSDASEDNISKVLEMVSHRLDDIEMSYKQIGRLIFEEIPRLVDERSIHRYWYNVAIKERAFYELPTGFYVGRL